jgi:hypothetical protein
MCMQCRKEQIDELRRKNEGLRIRTDWLNSMSTAMGATCSEANLLSLTQTEEIKQLFYKRLRDHTMIEMSNWQITDREGLLRHLASRIEVLQNSMVVVFSSVDDKVGSLYVEARSLLHNMRAVWDVVGGDFRLTTTCLDSGLCVGIEQYTLLGDYVREGIYELATWCPETRNGPADPGRNGDKSDLGDQQ